MNDIDVEKSEKMTDTQHWNVATLNFAGIIKAHSVSCAAFLPLGNFFQVYSTIGKL